MPLWMPLWIRLLAAHIGDFFTLIWEHIRDFLVKEKIVSNYDFSVINSRILTGAAPVDEGFVKALQEAGVTHIIDVTDAEDDRSLLPTNFPYLYNPTADDGTKKEPDWFAKSLTFALPMFAQPHTKLYTHCSAGINRGPSTAYAVMRALGWDSATALSLLKAKRPQVQARYSGDADAAIKALGYE